MHAKADQDKLENVLNAKIKNIGMRTTTTRRRSTLQPRKNEGRHSEEHRVPHTHDRDSTDSDDNKDYDGHAPHQSRTGKDESLRRITLGISLPGSYSITAHPSG